MPITVFESLAQRTLDNETAFFSLHSDSKKPVIGAAHIGWREAAQGLLERTIEAMTYVGARRETIMASIGPCAGVDDTYVVSDDFTVLPPNDYPHLASNLGYFPRLSL